MTAYNRAGRWPWIARRARATLPVLDAGRGAPRALQPRDEGHRRAAQPDHARVLALEQGAPERTRVASVPRCVAGRADRAAASPTGQDRRRSYAERGRYAAQVCRLTRHFPSAQILVLRSETLTDAHGRALEHIAQFLALPAFPPDRKSTRLNSSHPSISALFPYTTLFRSPIGPPRRQPGRTAGGRTPNVAAMPRRCAGSRAIFRPRRYSCCEAKR